VVESAGALLASAALVAGGVVYLSAPPALALAAATGGVGAALPYVEVQAENSSTNATIIGPSAAYGTLADEASYRKAVTLLGGGKYVEFTTPTPTNSIVFRYSIPDTSTGSVYTTPLSLYINGSKQINFTLTNAYSWYYGSYPFTNTPGSNPHHFYDEVHRLFTTIYPAGTRFRLQVDPEDTASSYTIDFADFENVAGALAQPAGSVSVTSRGADPTGSADSTAAFNSAIAAAGAGGTVWIPEGTFKIPGHLILNNVTIRGAGMWRSTVVGAAPGFYGNFAPNASSGVHLADFAIFGDVRERNDSAQVNGIGGALNNSTVDRVWIEHEKVGAWMDGPFTNLVFTGMRIRNTTADGINFHNGVTNSRLTNSDPRNLGDDGLATWSEQNADVNDSFDHNTVQYRPDQCGQYPHPAEPVRGDPVRVRFEHHQRKDQQCDHSEHRHLGRAGASRRIGHHLQQHRHRNPGAGADLQVWRWVHADRRRRKLRRHQSDGVPEHHQPGIPAVSAAQRWHDHGDQPAGARQRHVRHRRQHRVRSRSLPTAPPSPAGRSST
jgi:hypothetical protein